MNGGCFCEYQRGEIEQLVNEGIFTFVEENKELFTLLRNILSNKKVFKAISQLKIPHNESKEPFEEEVTSEKSTIKTEVNLVNEELKKPVMPNKEVSIEEHKEDEKEAVEAKPIIKKVMEGPLVKENTVDENLMKEEFVHTEESIKEMLIKEEAKVKKEQVIMNEERKDETRPIKMTKRDNKLAIKMTTFSIRIPSKLELHKSTEPFKASIRPDTTLQSKSARSHHTLTSLSTKNDSKTLLGLKQKRADPGLPPFSEKKWNIRINKTIEQLITQSTLTSKLKATSKEFSRTSKRNYFRTSVNAREKRPVFQLGDTIQKETQYTESNTKRSKSPRSLCHSKEDIEQESYSKDSNCWSHRNSKEVHDTKLELKDKMNNKKSVRAVQLLESLNIEKQPNRKEQKEESVNQVLEKEDNSSESKIEFEIVKVEDTGEDIQEEKLQEIEEEPDENKEESEDDTSLRELQKTKPEYEESHNNHIEEIKYELDDHDDLERSTKEQDYIIQLNRCGGDTKVNNKEMSSEYVESNHKVLNKSKNEIKEQSTKGICRKTSKNRNKDEGHIERKAKPIVNKATTLAEVKDSKRESNKHPEDKKPQKLPLKSRKSGIHNAQLDHNKEVTKLKKEIKRLDNVQEEKEIKELKNLKEHIVYFVPEIKVTLNSLMECKATKSSIIKIINDIKNKLQIKKEELKSSFKSIEPNTIKPTFNIGINENFLLADLSEEVKEFNKLTKISKQNLTVMELLVGLLGKWNVFESKEDPWASIKNFFNDEVGDEIRKFLYKDS